MAMEDLMKALMQSAGGTQQTSGGGDAMSQVLGGLLGGGQQGGSGASGDMLGQVIGGLLGGGQQASGGGAAVGQLLGGLQQIIGSQTGPVGAAATPAASDDPIMTLLQPLVNQLAAKAHISPAIATIIASIAIKYLLQSHPATPGPSPLDLGSVMQQLASGSGISQSTLQSSGMVNDVMRATGLPEQEAVRTLDTTFNVLGNHVKGAGVAGKANLRSKKKK